MFEYIVIGVLIVIIPIATLYFYEKGKKQGAKSFFELIANFGYTSKVNTFKSLNKDVPKGGIVFVGDSITQDYNVYEHFSGKRVYNRGIGGDTTEGLLKRMDVSIHELKPSVVVLLMGTNDFALLNAKPEDVFERMKRIVSEIKDQHPEVNILLQSVYPVNETIDPTTVLPRTNKMIDSLNDLLKTIEGVTYLDLSSKLKDTEGRFNKRYTLEGLHVSPEGYKLITDDILRYL
jgi:lysophospholipase L1-like esterase